MDFKKKKLMKTIKARQKNNSNILEFIITEHFILRFKMRCFNFGEINYVDRKILLNTQLSGMEIIGIGDFLCGEVKWINKIY